MYMMQQLLIIGSKVMYTLNKLIRSIVDLNRAVNVFNDTLGVLIDNINKRG